MNLKDLKELIAIFEEANITELDVERQGVRIRLKKGVENAPQIEIQSHPASPPQQAAAEEKAKEENLIEVKSPMVGTFYRAPTPDAPSFVEEGSEVSKGQVLCIIEAMKLMNEIKSEVDGAIRKVLVESGQAVEFNQPIFLIEVK